MLVANTNIDYKEEQEFTDRTRSCASDAPLARTDQLRTCLLEYPVLDKQKKSSQSERIMSLSDDGGAGFKSMPPNPEMVIPWPPLPFDSTTIAGQVAYPSCSHQVLFEAGKRYFSCAQRQCLESSTWFTETGIKNHIHLSCPRRPASLFLPRFYCPLDLCSFSHGSVLSPKELKEHAEDGWPDYDASSFDTALVFEQFKHKRLFCGFKDVFDLQIHLAFDHILEDVSFYEYTRVSEYFPSETSVREQEWCDKIFNRTNAVEVSLMRLVQLFTKHPRGVCQCKLHTNDCLHHATYGGLSCNGCGLMTEAVFEMSESSPDWLAEADRPGELTHLIKGMALANIEAYYFQRGNGNRETGNCVGNVSV